MACDSNLQLGACDTSVRLVGDGPLGELDWDSSRWMGLMNWVAFAAAFAVALGVVLAWHGFDAYMLPRARGPLAGGLLLLVALLAAWVVSGQSKSVSLGTLTAGLIDTVIAQVRLVRQEKRAAAP